jgi:hypothetical protein
VQDTMSQAKLRPSICVQSVGTRSKRQASRWDQAAGQGRTAAPATYTATFGIFFTLPCSSVGGPRRRDAMSEMLVGAACSTVGSQLGGAALCSSCSRARLFYVPPGT